MSMNNVNEPKILQSLVGKTIKSVTKHTKKQTETGYLEHEEDFIIIEFTDDTKVNFSSWAHFNKYGEELYSSLEVNFLTDK